MKYLLIVFLLNFGTVFAQKAELGIRLGGSNYKGDLAPEFIFDNIKPAGGIFFRYNPSYHVGLSANLNLGNIGAKDINTSDPLLQARNYWFNGSFYEFSGLVEYNFFNFRKSRRHFEKWCPFLFGGLGAAYFDIKTNLGDEKTASNGQIFIPFGVGVKHYLAKSWNLEFSFAARKTFSDTLDGIPYNENAPKFARTNPETTDMYYFFGISLSYVFNSVKCPTFYF